ncbi:DUF58 domain-containing protein [Opitutus sp. ER46]|nr:DUF58 domain-containing protein [Opitutus sp. ER46]
MTGVVLIALSLGIGMAAYNSSSNILFLTLALLLTCLVLSGVLSWLNFRGVSWELPPAPAMRAGHDALVALELYNRKAFLPTYGLWFNFLARPQRPPEEQRPETTLMARSGEVRAVFEQAQAAEQRGRVALAGRLDAQAGMRLEWGLRPAQRGRLRIELVSVGSFFPFGFLRKDIGTALTLDAVVWPALVEYRRHAPAAVSRRPGEERVRRPGTGNDLIAVRRYQAGDSHRLIHWKASARTRQLLVRQFAAETTQGHTVWLRTDAETWPRPEQFELLVGFAATLIEDLFRENRLLAVAINAEPPLAGQRVRDLEQILDRLAVLQPTPAARAGTVRPMAPRNLLTFAPEGSRGVGALVDGQRVASA